MQSSSTPCQRESLPPLSRAGMVRRSMTANITGRSMTSEELMPAMVAFYSRFYSAFSTFLALG